MRSKLRKPGPAGKDRTRRSAKESAFQRGMRSQLRLILSRLAECLMIPEGEKPRQATTRSRTGASG